MSCAQWPRHENHRKVRDATGAIVTVLVPYICSNVSVISERPHYYRHNGDLSVSEPAATASLAAALAALLAVTRLRRHRDKSH